jgi:drug/metabolite transporter (DMT)-like permease
LAIKQAPLDRFVALWGQFSMAAAVALPVVYASGGLPARAWWWIALSGASHLPYCWFLARAYTLGDFSLVYPIARGGGAMLAAVGGVALLGDHFTIGATIGVLIVGVGLLVLAGRGQRDQVIAAVAVAVTIGAYSTADAAGIRSVDTWRYAVASVAGTSATTSAFLLARGRQREMVEAVRAHWRRFLAVGLVSSVTYTLVQLAFRYAQVGYVTALRESSVVLAAFVGGRHLGEGQARRRIVASLIVVGGLITLVALR